MTTPRADRPRCHRCLFGIGADALLLAFTVAWGYAALIIELPYIPWEYPAAAALCVWSLVLLRRRRRHRWLALLSLVLPFYVLSCLTGVTFAAYLCPAGVATSFSLLLRRPFPSLSRCLYSYAAALYAMAPATFLSLQAHPLSVFRDRAGLCLLGITLLFLFVEQRVAPADKA